MTHVGMSDLFVTYQEDFGREGGKEGRRELCACVCVCVDRLLLEIEGKLKVLNNAEGEERSSESPLYLSLSLQMRQWTFVKRSLSVRNSSSKPSKMYTPLPLFHPSVGFSLPLSASSDGDGVPHSSQFFILASSL